jgi:uroporphyrinogen-III synthase
MPSASEQQPLAGIGVLVTRPSHQADGLVALIEQYGGRAVRFPVLEILDPSDAGPLHRAIDRLDDYDLAIFISPNAVNRAMNLILARRTMPADLQLAAIGRGSARALTAFGHPPDIFPDRRFDSEALLEMDAMYDVMDKRVLIIRGEGGREALGHELQERGAEVTYAEAYRRGRPDGNVDELMRQWSRGDVDIITITSNEGLRNLFEMVGKLGRVWLQKTPLVVVGERGRELASEMGFKAPIQVADEASDEGLVRALLAWRQRR